MLSPRHLGASASPSPAGADDKGPPVNTDPGMAQCAMCSLSVAPQLLSSGLRHARPVARWTLPIRRASRWDPGARRQSLPGPGQRRWVWSPGRAVWSRLLWSRGSASGGLGPPPLTVPSVTCRGSAVTPSGQCPTSALIPPNLWAQAVCLAQASLNKRPAHRGEGLSHAADGPRGRQGGDTGEFLSTVRREVTKR